MGGQDGFPFGTARARCPAPHIMAIFFSRKKHHNDTGVERLHTGDGSASPISGVGSVSSATGAGLQGAHRFPSPGPRARAARSAADRAGTCRGEDGVDGVDRNNANEDTYRR